MNASLDPSKIEWTKRILALIRVGGVWTFPRSAIRVTKLSETSVKLEGLEASSPIIRSYIEAAGYAIESSEADPDKLVLDHLQAAASAILAADPHENIRVLAEVTEKHLEEEGFSLAEHVAQTLPLDNDGKLQLSGIIVGTAMLSVGCCLLHHAFDLDHDEFHLAIDKTLRELISKSEVFLAPAAIEDLDAAIAKREKKIAAAAN